MDNLISLANDFHFIRPGWLLAIPLLLLASALLRRQSSGQAVEALVDAHLRPVVLDYPAQQRSAATRLLPVLALSLLILALAGPTWERLPQPLYHLQQGRVVVLSLSKSMDRRDMAPSRLQRAQFKISDLLASMPGLLNGLVAFAGDAFVVSPLSDDRDTILNLLQSLDSDTLPVQGTHADKGLEKARELLEQVGLEHGEIILVTDKASPLAVSTAGDLAKSGWRVSVLAVAPPDDHGEDALLGNIARSGLGVLARISADDSDIDRLNGPLKALLAQSNGKTTDSERKSDQWRDMGPWLLLPALLLFSLVFRRGWLEAA